VVMVFALHWARADWAPTFLVAASFASLFVLNRAGQISSRDARRHLQNGALVIDVRCRAEFNSGHLPRAVNLPLDEIEGALPHHVQDRNKVLLLHCQSGLRSGMAKKRLKAMGYENVFNLGSYGRAASIVADSATAAKSLR
jgi:phage shock protein E